MSRFRARRLKLLMMALALCVSLTAGMAAAYAADPIDPQTATGTITIQPQNEDKQNLTNTGARFSLYRVASVTSLSPLTFQLLPPFDESGVDINRTKTEEQIRAATGILDNYLSGLTPYAVMDGGAPRELLLGIYLVVNTGVNNNYIAAEPFLLFVPYYQDANGAWVLTFTAFPKLGYDPPDPPDDPPDRPTRTPIPTIPLGAPTPTPDDIPLGAPQTGMLQWPIPVFSGLGLMLIGGGTATLRSKSKDEDEV